MKSAIDQTCAEVYAQCFACLGDATRLRILNLLATATSSASVGEIVDAIGLSQSTVSHHLKRLHEFGFVVAEPRGTSTFYRVNEDCFECLPTAAELVMGQVPRVRRRRMSTPVPPWLEQAV